MMLHYWTAFALASAVLLVIPGPTVMLVVGRALAEGRRVALPTAAGVALGDLVAMTISLVGLGALLSASATLFAGLKWAGALYLIYLGIQLWRIEEASSEREATPRSAGQLFGSAFLVTVLNPKSLAFFVAFVPQFVDPSSPPTPQILAMVATFVTLSALNVVFYVFAAEGLGRQLRQPRLLSRVRRGGALCLIGMGVATVARRS